LGLIDKAGHHRVALITYRLQNARLGRQVEEALQRLAKDPRNAGLRSLSLDEVIIVRGETRPEGIPWHTLVYVDQNGRVVIHEAYLEWLSRTQRSPVEFMKHLVDTLGHENMERSGYTHEAAQTRFPLSKKIETALLNEIIQHRFSRVQDALRAMLD